MSQQPEKTVKAVRFVGAGCPAQVVDVPIPRPGPGEILVKIGGAGACHSDLHVLKHGRRGAPPQFTLGHENAGWIAALGSGIRGWKEGDAVAVYPLWGCGQCPACAKSAENYCVSFRPEMPRQFGGLGRDGGMAEYMLVPDGRLLVRLGQVDPKAADRERVIHHVDISWNQSWTETDLVRFYKLDGNTLTITTARAQSTFEGEEGQFVLVWEKVR
jgi:D-arabinose 1-dehydrogenase-like Zn-dependent alcohol dehydrogenase